MADQTRYQILYSGSSKIENFTAKEKFAFMKRVQELRRKGVRFTTWDTRRNALSDLIRF